MKRFLSSFLFVLLVFPMFAQTNTVTKFNAKESDGLYKVDVTFTTDSVGTLVTEPFTVPKYDLTYSADLPIIFRFKTVSTYGTPKVSMFLQGIYTTATDTASLDTIRYEVAAQVETDSIGVLTMNGKYAPAYKLYIRNIGGDINAGRLQLLFPIKPRYYR